MRKLLAGIAAVLLGTAAAQAEDKKTGLYVGATAGYIWGSYDTGEAEKASAQGAVGGIVAGYAQRHGGVVFGFETEILAAGVEHSSSEVNIRTGRENSGSGIPFRRLYRFDQDYKSNALASLRLKLQVDATPWFKPYITGGLAVQRFEGRQFTQRKSQSGEPLVTRVNSRRPEKLDQTQLGITVGAGAILSLSKNLDIDLGYQLYRFDQDFYYRHADEDEVDDGVLTSLHSVRVGLNYKF